MREYVSAWDEPVSALLGLAAWEVFSSNNEVSGPGGEVYDLGSWRSSGGFIADVLNDRRVEAHFDYLDFYMGFLSRDEHIRPLYVRFFELLSRAELRMALCASCDLHDIVSFAIGRSGACRDI